MHHFKLPVDLRLVTMIVPSSKFSSLGLSRDDRRPGDQMTRREYYLQCFKEGLSLFVHILNLRIWQGTPAEPAAHWQTRTRTRLSAIRLRRSRRPRGTSELGTPAPGPIIGYDDMGRQLTY